MATIKQRIEDVTENVTDGKIEIASAINSKNARNTNVNDTSTFSSMASAINTFNIEKISTPSIGWNQASKTLTLSNTNSEATNQYKLSSSSSWTTYSSPIKLSTLGTYDFRAYRNGSVDSDIISQTLESVIKRAKLQSISLYNNWDTNILATDLEIGDGDYLGEVWMNGYTGNSICIALVFHVGETTTWEGDVEYLKLDRIEYNGSNDNMRAWLETTGAFRVDNPNSSVSTLAINPKGFKVTDAETFTLVFSDSSGNEITATFNIEWMN